MSYEARWERPHSRPRCPSVYAEDCGAVQCYLEQREYHTVHLGASGHRWVEKDGRTVLVPAWWE